MKGVLLFVVFSLASSAVFGQPGDPGGGGNPTPITGIEFLLGGGALIGFRSLMARIRSKKQ